MTKRETTHRAGTSTADGQARDTTESEAPGATRWAWRRNPTLNLTYRIGVGIAGTLVLLLGVVLIPYPGPGWLVVFAGLAILATEFAWAGRVLRTAKRYYDGWADWLRRQHLAVRLLVLALTGLVVLATLWALNVFGLVAGWFGLDLPWLGSPFFASGG
ncbi:TIGR02611 family protein [Goodfellowiella coeruleoviolacea]|uniref:TIGR02611 family protein n=1 Tax=Goodfellowiella coeruleoviolacea TaxID=334858 RepID=A0AAE3GEA3_9PSEU|nr:TIGR02611 family protein [Goodfellowiella coeruleoviolacea]MCP2166570.1 TIGR02611 family protein [Goodfellowiella coeruleoviolacea]